MAKNKESKNEPVRKQRHAPFRTLTELVLKPRKQIVDLFRSTEDITEEFVNYPGRGIKLDRKSFSQKYILDQIPFSAIQLELIETSLKKGIAYLEEQNRSEDAKTYASLVTYFHKRSSL